MDLVVVSLVAILPALVFSWRRARAGKWAVHRRTQLILGGTLSVAVSLFEVDIRMAGGIWELTKESRYAGTSILTASV